MSARGQLKGRRVMVKLIDGTKFVDVFVDNTSRQIILQNHGRIKREIVKKMSPFIDSGFAWIGTRTAEEFDQAQAREFPHMCPIRVWNHSLAHYCTCQKPLCKEGKCEDHGAVRFSPYLKQAASLATLRKQPPRKLAGKTVAQMIHVRKVHGW